MKSWFYDLANPILTFPPHSILSLTKNYCRSLHVLKFLVLIYLSVLKSKKNWRIPVVKPTSRMILLIWTISKRNPSPAQRWGYIVHTYYTVFHLFSLDFFLFRFFIFCDRYNWETKFWLFSSWRDVNTEHGNPESWILKSSSLQTTESNKRANGCISFFTLFTLQVDGD